MRKNNILAIRLLESVGFKINKKDISTGIFGTRKQEDVNIYIPRFIPLFRDVYIGKANDGYYVTSHIIGNIGHIRKSKAKNVFGSGKTKLKAVRSFLKNFTATPIIYNEKV